MPRIPRDNRVDSTLAMIFDPDEYISKTCRRLGTDLFQTRLMLRTAICMTGPEAAELFYDESRFMRRDCTPRRCPKVLGYRTLRQTPSAYNTEVIPEPFLGRRATRCVARQNDSLEGRVRRGVCPLRHRLGNGRRRVAGSVWRRGLFRRGCWGSFLGAALHAGIVH